MGVDYDVCSSCGEIFNDHDDTKRDACNNCMASFCGECAVEYVHYTIVDPDVNGGQPYIVPLEERGEYDSTGCALCTKDVTLAKIGHDERKAVRLLGLLLGLDGATDDNGVRRTYFKYRMALREDASGTIAKVVLQSSRIAIADATVADAHDTTLVPTSASLSDSASKKQRTQ
jgi:hypothetical protein